MAQQGYAYTFGGLVRVTRSVFRHSDQPLDASCDCAVCSRFSRGYLHHLAPPTLNKAAKNGEPKKSKYGPWMMPAFRVLAKLRRYRGTALDIFARSPERKMERALIGEYEAVVAEILDRMTPQNYPIAVDLASIPEHIRGYGHVKDRHLKDAKVREKALLAQLRDAKAPAVMAPVIVHAG